MTIAIVIVNWNSGTRLHAAVDSVLSTHDSAEIVIVDNASVDRSLDSIDALGPRVRTLRNASNRGLAAAWNQAFAATTAPFVLVLNPDARALPGAIAKLEAFLHEHPRAGAAGGYVNDVYLPRNLPTWHEIVRQNLGFAPRTSTLGNRHTARQVEQPAAAALMIRREAFAQIGGFDAQFYPAWYEDVDFCRRLRTSGWEIWFAPEAEFAHEGGYSMRTMGIDAYLGAYYRNQIRYAKKHCSGPALAPIRLSIAARMAAHACMRPGQARACARVIAGALGKW